jgi:hypothetical protein
MYLSVARMDDDPHFVAEWLLRGVPGNPLCSVVISEDCNILLTAPELDDLVKVLATALAATPLDGSSVGA